jgi:SAM-dependent methyltransferase
VAGLRHPLRESERLQSVLRALDQAISGTADGDAAMRTVKLDLLVDPMPAKRYDIIYSLMTLHHVLDTDAILQRFHAALAPNGLLCIADLDAEDRPFHGAGFDGPSVSILRCLARRRGRPDSRPWNFQQHMRSRRGSTADRAIPSS